MADHDSPVNSVAANIPVEQLASVGDRVLRKEGSNSRESNARKRHRRAAGRSQTSAAESSEAPPQEVDEDHVDYRA